MKFFPFEQEKMCFYWQEDPSKIQQGRKSGKWLKVEIVAIKGSMAVINIASTIFQASRSKLRRPYEQEHLFNGSLAKDKQIVWEMFSDNSY